MFAIDHAATALVIERRFPGTPRWALLLSVQASELLWVALNLLGVERVTTEPAVHSVSDVHLAYMPWSHSVATMLAAAGLAWLVLRAAGRPRLGLALGIGVASHLVLDLLTHDHDLAIAPGLGGRLGLGLYGSAPMVAFLVELAYGLACWRVFRGSRALLGAIVVFNLANVTFFSARIPGPEELLAGHPTAVVLVVLTQIVVTLVLVGVLARRSARTATRGIRGGGGPIAVPSSERAVAPRHASRPSGPPLQGRARSRP